MSKIKIGVVEDEVIIADSLCQTLLQLGYEVTEPAASYSEAMTMIDEETPDLLLLDIQIKGQRDGIDVANALTNTHRLPIIFLTANADAATVQRAKETKPNAYLVKPFTREDLYTAIEVCLHNATAARTENNGYKNKEKANDSLFIKEGAAFHKVRFADILYLESEHVYVQIHTHEKKYLVRTSMQQYLLQFDEKKFLRIHRSYVVNLDRVDSVTQEYVLVQATKLPIGKTYIDELFARLKIN